MSSVNQPMSISKKNVKPCHPKFMIFHANKWFWGKYLYVNHTLYFIQRKIILYLDKNYTLFGNLAVATLHSQFIN